MDKRQGERERERGGKNERLCKICVALKQPCKIIDLNHSISASFLYLCNSSEVIIC